MTVLRQLLQEMEILAKYLWGTSIFKMQVSISISTFYLFKTSDKHSSGMIKKGMYNRYMAERNMQQLILVAFLMNNKYNY